ncbi:FtsK/SpoIIIE domain-containing protein [Thermogemmata fonticola]|uniref:AAA family ATPase n=1 Tax=Thermogemmata fonticola TaxID=2755323 RepID=A0A7V8VHB9_9BACT|nr:FtsK/SpoIIIE domain-containing protein [Thermogemmata fonticola]MBA2227905.1 AAA family ATPase [Thermogemmata fonticola]
MSGPDAPVMSPPGGGTQQASSNRQITETLSLPRQSWFEQQYEAFQQLLAIHQERQTVEAEITAAWEAEREKAEWDLQRQRKSIEQTRTEQLSRLEAEHQQALEALQQHHQSEEYALHRQRDELLHELDRKYHQARKQGEEDYQDQLWRADSLLEAGEKAAKEQWEAAQRQAAAAQEQLEKMGQILDRVLQLHHLQRADIPVPVELPPPTPDEPAVRLQKCLDLAQEQIEQWQQLRWPHWRGWRVAFAAALLTAALSVPPAFLLLPPLGASLAALLITGPATPILTWLWHRQVRQRLLKRGRQLAETLANAERAARLLSDAANSQYAQEMLLQKEKHAERRRRADEHYLPLLQNQKERYENQRQRLMTDFEHKIQKAREQFQTQLERLKQGYAQARQEAESRFASQLAEAEAACASRLKAAEAVRESSWQKLSERWNAVIEQVSTTVAALRQANDIFFPPWSRWQSLPPPPWPTRVPWGIRYGDFLLDLAALPGGQSHAGRCSLPDTLLGRFPAFIPFPNRSVMLLRVRDEGRAAGVAVLQNLMLRFLTGLPPGKVRFTIVDPVGLGENFAAFMHLADYDEKLISGHIWTEPRDIEQRLADLTEHVTSVIQKYLRSQFSSIEEYNEAAGEVAEPYRVLVVANFPAGFTPEAAQRLLSLAATGPSCGVCVLLSADTRQAMPRDFSLSALEALSLTLTWKEGRFVPKDAVLSAFPLELEAPPDVAALTELIRRAGAASLQAGRVEVPFDFIAPPADQVWTADASRTLAVPIGRAGATRRQVFRLGEGTAQHALVAGKTGSGKSTLLHALITNLALMYSPDEVELYLIDFKEGVEFQWYAALRLPHARVVAIESEREFGLSVLQRLDGLLRERGEQFRQAGVNELSAYRQWQKREVAAGRLPPDAARCPRVLLIIDEFQQLFVEDDKLAQEAALLLDRLVRQGRAFGIHVLLGSQTLGGAYSLPRSTLDQMAVRIALQCSDADAQLILSKDNTAARLLSRPGEAIYNDQSGLVEGNEPFQVVWLPESRRVEILEQLRQRAQERWPAPIVFAGHTHADVTANPALQHLWDHPAPAKAPLVWVGDPVAIRPPTAVPFRSQGGAHLLLIGQNEEAARGLITAACLSLLPQLSREEPSPSLVLLDGTPDDAEMADFFPRLAQMFPPLYLPLRSQLASALAELGADLQHRANQAASPESRKRFLLIFGIQRFRELRKAEDDFGFARRAADRETTPAEHLATLLRDGPALGLHTIIWCDSLTNLQRTFERSQLRDFAWRVLFQMSPNDSSHLMDSPAAARLGRHRALLLTEESERPEKFRPYGIPPVEWLQRLAAKWQQHRSQKLAVHPAASPQTVEHAFDISKTLPETL